MSLSCARKHNCSSCCDYCQSDLAEMIGISCDLAWMIMALVLGFFGLIAWNLAVTAGWDLQLLLPWLLLELLLPWLLSGLCLLSEWLLSWLLSEVSLAHATWLKKFYYKKKKHIIKCVCDQIWSRVFNFEKGEKLKILKSEEFVTINFNNKFVTD